MLNYETAGTLLDRNITSLERTELALLTVVAHKFKGNWDTIRKEWDRRAAGKKMTASVDGKVVDIDYMTKESASYPKTATLLGKKDLTRITKYSVDMTAVKAIKDVYQTLLDGGALTAKTSVCVEVKDEKAGK